MLDRKMVARALGSLVQGASRGLAITLGVMLVMDAAAIGDLTGAFHLGLPHPKLVPSLILTLLPIVILFEMRPRPAR
jgi:hypothetical protein